MFGELGHPVRSTVSQIGPTLLARILELNDVQAGALAVAFEVADREGLLLLDLKDLRALLNHVAENRKAISTAIGLVNAASIGAIQRALLRLEQDGAEAFFGEPALELVDLMRQDMSGRGIINVLCAERLLLKPRLYSTFLLWLLSELFETLPEVGDQEQPRLVFFFDEAHLLFRDAPAALVQRVEQVVRLIRSKGVGVYFCTQLPDDVPNAILGQLANRIQHGLRAFTPRDQKAIRSVAETFVANPEVDVAKALIELGTGEALVTTLDEKGTPTPVQKAVIAPPRCRMGAITPEERQTVHLRSPVGAKYDTVIDRESAYEMLKLQAEEAAQRESDNPVAPPPAGEADEGIGSRLRDWLLGTRRRQGAGGDDQVDHAHGRQPPRAADRPRHPGRDDRRQALTAAGLARNPGRRPGSGADAQLAQGALVIRPAGADLHPQLQVHLAIEQPFHGQARLAADLAQAGAPGTNDDGLLALALNPDRGMDPAQPALQGIALDLHGGGIGQLLAKLAHQLLADEFGCQETLAAVGQGVGIVQRLLLRQGLDDRLFQGLQAVTAPRRNQEHAVVALIGAVLGDERQQRRLVPDRVDLVDRQQARAPGRLHGPRTARSSASKCSACTTWTLTSARVSVAAAVRLSCRFSALPRPATCIPGVSR